MNLMNTKGSKARCKTRVKITPEVKVKIVEEGREMVPKFGSFRSAKLVGKKYDVAFTSVYRIWRQGGFYINGAPKKKGYVEENTRTVKPLELSFPNYDEVPLG